MNRTSRLLPSWSLKSSCGRTINRKNIIKLGLVPRKKNSIMEGIGGKARLATSQQKGIKIERCAHMGVSDREICKHQGPDIAMCLQFEREKRK